MSDKRCGTCRWWDDKPFYLDRRICMWLCRGPGLPFYLAEQDGFGGEDRATGPTEGTDCDAWEERAGISDESAGMSKGEAPT